MSWSASLEIVLNQDQDAQITVKHRQQQSSHGEAESVIAIEKAIEVAQEIINKKVLGYGTFDVNLSGHSNPGNQPSSGWVNDNILIRIDQRKS